MVVISGDPEGLVGLYRIGRMSAHDALLILKRLEKRATAEEMEKVSRVRGYLEDMAATEKALGILRFHRKKPPTAGQQIGFRMQKPEIRV